MFRYFKTVVVILKFIISLVVVRNYGKIIYDLIKYKQWVSTYRSQLEDNEEDFDDFLAKL